MRIIVLALLTALWLSPSGADQWRFHMNDGSVVIGTMSGFANGIYRVDSPALGRIQLSESEIQSIVRVQQVSKPAYSSPQSSGRLPGSNPYPASPAQPSGLLDVMPETVRSQILTDPRTLAGVMGLQGHPGVRRILANPQAMDAVRRGDFQMLARDPYVQQLLHEPVVQRILSQLNHR